ncbi:MAG TPA: type III-B CRISPR module RAMP protein Cmr1 [Thermotogota bacterium]|nr:type III-B CRISPR module RAMP protein Cmr1 [Thermotogota bacterium]
MQTIELTLQFNTPVFARGGSDGFEITPQSIKGIMRFWYRALLPNVIDIHRCGKDTKPYCGMKRAEELLFGSTTQRSLFDVEVETKGIRQDFGSWGTNPHHGGMVFNPKEFPASSGGNYAAYGMSPKPGDTIRKYLTPGSQAILTFVFRNKSLTEEMRDFFLYLWGVISMFGGIGAKSRKGYGSFDIEKVKVNGEDFDFSPTRILYPRELHEILGMVNPRIINVLRNLDNETLIVFEPQVIDVVPPFPILQSNCWFYRKKYVNSDWKSALEGIFSGKGIRGKRSYEGIFNIYRTVKIKRLRLKNSEDKDGVQAVREIIYSQPPSYPHDQWEVAPTILGLPLLYQNIGPTKDSTGPHTGEVNNPTGRKASPLFVSIHKKNNNTFAFLLLIPSQISSERTKDDKPILTVKPSTKKDKEFPVLGNEDFADLKNKLLAAFDGGGNP